jgi:hypothetical protein
MNKCEDCGDPCKRRKQCYHCGLFVCSSCWHNEHKCEPGHSRDKCFSLKSYRRFGKDFLTRLRVRVLLLKEEGKEYAR